MHIPYGSWKLVIEELSAVKDLAGPVESTTLIIDILCPPPQQIEIIRKQHSINCAFTGGWRGRTSGQSAVRRWCIYI